MIRRRHFAVRYNPWADCPFLMHALVIGRLSLEEGRGHHQNVGSLSNLLFLQTNIAHKDSLKIYLALYPISIYLTIYLKTKGES